MGSDQSTQEVTERSYISFIINGKEYQVHPAKHQVGANTLLVDYIRDHAYLKGTKYFCREGGCGACLVMVKTRDLNTGQITIRSINSCLIPVFACDGWDITTVEHLGNKNTGYHPIQERIVKFHGTQCGYCAPGVVMNFYSQMESKKQLKIGEVEDGMDGNICRCTGYRPILDAIKSLAVDATEEIKRKSVKNGLACPLRPCEGIKCNAENFETCTNPTVVHLQVSPGNKRWVKAVDMNTLFIAIQKFQNLGIDYRFVGGNTGTGVYKHEGPFQGFIDLNSVQQLKIIRSAEKSLSFGGAVTISTALETLEKASSKSGFEYCKVIWKHWKRVANVSVRNGATLAGNLMLKHNHPEFPSDIFLVLESVGAMLTIAISPSLQKTTTLQEFLQMDMKNKILYSIDLPQLQGYQLKTFKITPRSQNAHAMLNAGFLMQIDSNYNNYVKTKPRIVYGGVSPQFIHASNTETFLMGKYLNEQTIQDSLTILEEEINPEVRQPESEPSYRKLLAQALLYKFFLQVLGDVVPAKFKSGAIDFDRGISYGKQVYDTSDKSNWPMYEPVTRYGAAMQTSGEIEYVNDISPESGELQGAVVLSAYGNAALKNVDATVALNIPGVIAWIDYKAIPGDNNYMYGFEVADVIFVEEKIEYAGQPIGLIVAETREIALNAVKYVNVEYADIKAPVLDIPTALEKARVEGKKISTKSCGGSSRLSQNAPHKVTGKFSVGTQNHFCMEPHVCICVPKEGHLNVHASTQCVDFSQIAIANCLKIPINNVTVDARRLGGSFGSKANRGVHVTTMCAIAAFKIGRPVRLTLDIETTMCSLGRRLPHSFSYEVGFDDTGKIMNMEVEIASDTGCNGGENSGFLTLNACQNVYSADPLLAWKANLTTITTNTPPNTYVRAPGAPKAIACTEWMMDHVAHYLKKDPFEVRLLNLMKKGDNLVFQQSKLEEENLIPTMVEELMLSADVQARRKFVNDFNVINRWKKRGLALMPVRYPSIYYFSDSKVYISVYAGDGSVTVSHSGIEMGQGINTKVMQVVAKELGVPVSKVDVKIVDSIMGANACRTAAGTTSETTCYAAIKACKILNERLEPMKTKLGSPTWEQLVAEAKKEGMDLTTYASTTFADNLKNYSIWSLCASEVEIDCLTGEHNIIRVDLLFDAGSSLNPDIDVGQVEGAFVMGLGWLLMEKMQYNQATGELLTNRTWNYKVPTAKDIPQDFRVTLMKKFPNAVGIMRSKTASESPFSMSFSVVLAIREAISSARKDAGDLDWFHIETPITPADIQRLCLTKECQFKIS